MALSVAPADGERKQWVHYLPAGKFACRDGRGPYRLDDAQAFATQSFRYSAGQPIPVDFDHALEASQTARTPAPAAGWISQLAARPDGVWGLTEWTPRAAAHLAAKEYRFVSPVFFHTTDGAAMALKAAALTNQPALPNLTAVCSTGKPMDLDQLCAALRPLLGLSESAMRPVTMASLSSTQSIRLMTRQIRPMWRTPTRCRGTARRGFCWMFPAPLSPPSTRSVSPLY